MHVTTYLNFDGQCAEAFRFYEQCLGGKIEVMMPYGESPMAGQVGPEMSSRILHASLKVGELWLMGADVPSEGFVPPQGFSVMIALDDVERAERVFDALAKGGTIRMALQETFWALRFGMLVDQFGTPWMVNCAASAS